MLSILQPEISTLESRIAQMQAEIASAQQRIALLAETELLAGGSLEALKTVVLQKLIEDKSSPSIGPGYASTSKIWW